MKNEMRFQTLIARDVPAELDRRILTAASKRSRGASFPPCETPLVLGRFGNGGRRRDSRNRRSRAPAAGNGGQYPSPGSAGRPARVVGLDQCRTGKL